MAKDAAGLGARRAAVSAVEGALDEGRTIEDGLAAAKGFAALEARDRAFARLIAATALRRLGQIDAALDAFLQRDPGGRTRAILRCAAAELIFLEVAPHAAVSSAASLAGEERTTRKMKGLVNAVARRVSESGAEIAAVLPPEANLPAWLRESWTAAWGAEATRAIAAVQAAEPPLDLTARGDPAEAARLARGALLPTGSVRLPGRGRVEDIPGFAEGEWWVQDAAAAIPARLLAAGPGETAYDLCAAPGGKALQLAAAGAKVTAVDAAAQRLERLRENLARTGLAAEIAIADVLDWAPEGPADAVLLDAPCSATGTLRRHPEAAWTRGPKDVTRLAGLQRRLLERAADLVRPGGRLVYCVCSLQPEEGEAQAAAFLKRREDFTLAPVAAEEVPGLAEAVTAEGTLRILPAFWADRGGLDGFFAARFERRHSAAVQAGQSS